MVCSSSDLQITIANESASNDASRASRNDDTNNENDKDDDDEDDELERLRLEALNAKRLKSSHISPREKQPARCLFSFCSASSFSSLDPSTFSNSFSTLVLADVPARFRYDRESDEEEDDDDDDDAYQPQQYRRQLNDNDADDDVDENNNIHTQQQQQQGQGKMSANDGEAENNSPSPSSSSSEAERLKQFHNNYQKYRIECSKLMANDAYEPNHVDTLRRLRNHNSNVVASLAPTPTAAVAHHRAAHNNNYGHRFDLRDFLRHKAAGSSSASSSTQQNETNEQHRQHDNDNDTSKGNGFFYDKPITQPIGVTRQELYENIHQSRGYARRHQYNNNQQHYRSRLSESSGRAHVYTATHPHPHPSQSLPPRTQSADEVRVSCALELEGVEASTTSEHDRENKATTTDHNCSESENAKEQEQAAGNDDENDDDDDDDDVTNYKKLRSVVTKAISRDNSKLATRVFIV